MSIDQTTYRNWRLNILAAVAFIVVVLCLIITVFFNVSDEFAKGIITLVLGRFLGYVDAVYNFEFGTTRGSKAKDDAITNLAAASPIAPSVVTAAAIDASRNGNGKTLKVENVQIDADNATVNEVPAQPPQKEK